MVSMTINTVAADNCLNRAESGVDQTISGTTSGIEDGQPITITINNVNYNGTVTKNAWSIKFPSADEMALTDGSSYVLTARAASKGGVVAQASLTIKVQRIIPVIYINTIGRSYKGQQMLNVDDCSHTYFISGTTLGDDENQQVELTLNLRKYYAPAIDSSHSNKMGTVKYWQIPLSANDLGSLVNGQVYTFTANIKDKEDNPATKATQDVLIKNRNPMVTIDVIAGDDILTGPESLSDLTITGTTNVEDDQVLTMTFNKKTYTCKVSGGKWSIVIPVNDLVALPTGYDLVSVTVDDLASNHASASRNVLVKKPAINITTTSKTFNKENCKTDQSLTGTVNDQGQAGQTVQVIMNGKTYTGTYNGSGTWSIPFPAADNQALVEGTTYTIRANLLDSTGRLLSWCDKQILIDRTAPNITIDVVSKDDILSDAECRQTPYFTFTGTTTAEIGNIVTFTINGKSYQVGVLSRNPVNIWVAYVFTYDMIQLTDGTSYIITADVTDTAGNPAPQAKRTIRIDRTAIITVDTVFGDNILSLDECKTDQTITGTVTNIEDGQTITITLYNFTLKTTVVNGIWSVVAPKEKLITIPVGNYYVYASGNDIAGNYAYGRQLLQVTRPTISIGLFTPDDIISFLETQTDQTLGGNITNFPDGSNISITINGKTYRTTSANSKWSITVPTADLRVMPDAIIEIDAFLYATDNTVVATAKLNFTVKRDPPMIQIYTVGINDVINLDECNTQLGITGTAAPECVGQTVTVTFNNVTYTTTMQVSYIGYDYNRPYYWWTVIVPHADLMALSEGPVYTIRASVANRIGNVGTTTRNVTVDRTPPVIMADAIVGTDILTGLEVWNGFRVTGTTVGCQDGQPVSATLNGRTYQLGVTKTGKWAGTISGPELLYLQNDTNYDIVFTVYDQARNIGTTTRTVRIQRPVFTFNPFTPDNILNNNESNANQVLSGSITRTTAGSYIQITLWGGKVYSGAKVLSDVWSQTISSYDLQKLPDATNFSYTVQVFNSLGQKLGEASATFSVDRTSPTIYLYPGTLVYVNKKTISDGDWVINGYITLDAKGQPLVLTFNGKKYTTIIDTHISDGQTLFFWKITIPAADMAALKDGQNYQISVISNDVAGNISNPVTENVIVDTIAPTVTIDPIGVKDFINYDYNKNLVFTGTTVGCEDGSTAKVSIWVVGGQGPFVGPFNGTITNNTWSMLIPGFKSWSSRTDYIVQVDVFDKAGNPGTARRQFGLDNTVPVVVITSPDPTKIDIPSITINYQASLIDLVINGTTNKTVAFGSMKLTLNGKDYPITVGANWTVTIPKGDINSLPDNTNYTFTVYWLDGTGKTIAQASKTLIMCRALPNITMDTIAGDNILNGDECTKTLTVTGTVIGNATNVTLTFNNMGYNATISNNKWSVSIPAEHLTLYPLPSYILLLSQEIVNGHTYTFKASVFDKCGNTATTSTDVLVDISNIVLDPIFTDDKLDGTELTANQKITGTCDKAADGTAITVLLNGRAYTTTVTGGKFMVIIPVADLVVLLNQTRYYVTANMYSNANVLINFNSRPFLVSVSQIIIKSATVQIDGSELVSGIVINIDPGTTVTVTLNKKSYTTTVNPDLTWSVTVPKDDYGVIADGKYTIVATGGGGGGGGGVSDKQTETKSTLTALGITTIANNKVPLSGGAITLLTEDLKANNTQPVSGKTIGFKTGATITVALNGKTYTGPTDANGNWTINIPTDDLLALSNNTFYDVVVTGTAVNGNNLKQAVQIKTIKPGLFINVIVTSDIFNIVESQTTQPIDGTAVGIPDGRTCQVSLNGKTYNGKISNAHWVVWVPSSDLKLLTDGGSYVVNAFCVEQPTLKDSRTIWADRTAPIITEDPITGDDIANSDECKTGISISGTTTGCEDGQTVVVSLAGTYYLCSVLKGVWSVQISSDLLMSLDNGQTYDVAANVVDKAGNPALVSRRGMTVWNKAPFISIDAVTGDDYLDANECSKDLTITGTVSGGCNGQPVTFVLNGKKYIGKVAGSKWSVIIPSADLIALPDDVIYPVTADVTDTSGNAANTAKRNVYVNKNPASIVIDPISLDPVDDTYSRDNIFNIRECKVDQKITGTCTNIADGKTITVTLNNQAYTVAVKNNSWSITVTSNQLMNLTDGQTYPVVATFKNALGNIGAQATRNVRIDRTAPTIAINALFGDDVLNIAESKIDESISGTTVGCEINRKVTVTLNNKTYFGFVDKDGLWSVNIPTADLTVLKDGQTYIVTADVTDLAGNPAIQATRKFTVDFTPPVITIDAFTGDDILTKPESQQDQLVTGTTTAEDGQTVSVFISNKTYTGTASKGKWSIKIPSSDLLGLKDQTTYTITATVSDVSGNPATAKRDFLVDWVVRAISINPIAGDDVFNIAECKVDQVITGSTIRATDGWPITVTLNGKTYKTTAQNNLWSITVPTADLMALTDGNTYKVTAVLTWPSGSTSADRNVLVDRTAPTIGIDVIAGDDVINNSESQNSLDITGPVNGADGQTVTVKINGKTYTTTANGGRYKITMPAGDVGALNDGQEYIVTADVSDAAGNPAVQAQRKIRIDKALPTVTIDVIAGDDVLNGLEVNNDITITGTTTKVEDGRILTMTLNGKSYTCKVTAGKWSIVVPKADLQVLKNGTKYTVVATVTNKAGNTAQASRDISLNVTIPKIAINVISGDDCLNIQEIKQDLPISGTTDVEDGQIVTVTFNGKTYTATVSKGAWALTVPKADLTNLKDGQKYTVTADVKNKVGTPAPQATRPVLVDLSVPTIAINAICGDGCCNKAEVNQNQTISGTTNAGQGQQVTVGLNNKSYTGTVKADGTWSVIVPSADMLALDDGSQQTATADVSDIYGNPAVQATKTFKVNRTIPVCTLFINTVTDGQTDNSYKVAPGHSCIAGCGGPKGFGARVDPIGGFDDAFYGKDVSTVFQNGFNFFGKTYSAKSDFYIGINGFITFGQGSRSYDAVGLAGIKIAMIAPHFNDTDTINGGDIYLCVDAKNKFIAVTYYKVAPFKQTPVKDDTGKIIYNPPINNQGLENSYQLRLYDLSTNGSPADFAIEFRYENIDWIYSGNTRAVSAGWSAGDQTNYDDISNSFIKNNQIDITNESNINQPGVFVWEVHKIPRYAGDVPCSGTATPGTTVTVFSNGVAMGTTTADADGKWKLTILHSKFTNGQHDMTAQSADACGNVSALTDKITIQIV